MPHPPHSPPLPHPEGRVQRPSGRARSPLGGVLSLLLALCLVWMAPVPAARAAWLHLEGPVPADLGVGANGLAPCGSPAHCASASWPVADAPAALAGLLPSVLALEGVELVETRESYLHATVTSRLFGFVDDLELFADGPRQQIQARSQSRLGDSDLGVNGRRLERLHRALQNTPGALAVAARPNQAA
jgi:uncharacterized protein (DUF1499 family)